MPASESTWRDQRKLHFLFAISGMVLFIATLWMFYKDNKRQWKGYQDLSRQVQIVDSRWQEEHVETLEKQEEHARLEQEMSAARAALIAPALMEEFKTSLRDDLARRLQDKGSTANVDEELKSQFAKIDRLYGEFSERAQAAVTAGQKATSLAASAAAAEKAGTDALVSFNNAERALATAAAADKPAAQAKVDDLKKISDARQAEATKLRSEADPAFKEQLAAELAAGKARDALLEELRNLVAEAKFREDRLLQERKFENANLDKAKADEGLFIRDAAPADQLTAEQNKAQDQRHAQLEASIHEVQSRVEKLTLQYQAALEHRQTLQGVVKQITTAADEINKKLEANVAERVQLEKAIVDKRSTYVAWWGNVPLPGKKWLELPILDAFNSPLKIQNLWSDDLTINYSSAYAQRFDRCTTCHQLMEKAEPGAPEKPGFVRERDLTLILTPPTKEQYQAKKKQAESEERPLTVAEVYGVSIASGGYINRNDVAVTNVVASTLATQARLLPSAEVTTPVPGDKLRDMFAMPATAEKPLHQLDDPNSPFQAQPGIRVGDVLVYIDDSLIQSPGEAERLLLAGAAAGKPLHVRVRRGLPHPFTSHPRLDLFVGSGSPHKLQDFACSICHEGQGSATEFKWASHTPNSTEQMKEWSRDYGWFDNHHWIFPMNPKRFVESSCLKCHHEVVELEPSEKFPEPPAPTLVRGYNVIRKYGCYGCHEINGFDGPDKRVGPDLRLEPNYFAAALQLRADPSFAKLGADVQGWTNTVVAHPENRVDRKRLEEFLLADQTATKPQLSADSHSMAPLLKEVEAAGSLRKPGPSLRFAAKKLDGAFLYDWIGNPRNFRPNTRMPRVFGLWNHLQDSPESLAVSKRFEPVEILGIATYLQQRSQQYEYLEPPAEVTTPASAARGKMLFQTRGCMACHSHGDFPEAEAFRDPEEIVQGPNLSNLAQKFAPDRNPNGRKWLYSWIKEPTRYHPRTVMPNLFLDPIEVTVAPAVPPDAVPAAADAAAAAQPVTPTKVLTDPAADIVEFLLSSSEQTKSTWQPVPAQDPEAVVAATPAAGEGESDGKKAKPRTALDDLVLEHLKDAFAVRSAEKYVETGIPADRAAQLKGAERELLMPAGQTVLSREQKLAYVGRKSIIKYGCYGCHDIPGFEDAKPIGAGLNDWGRKEPAKLAFEHVVEYLHDGAHDEGFGAGAHGAAAHQEGAHAEAAAPEAEAAADAPVDRSLASQLPHLDAVPEFFRKQIDVSNRSGFLYQKLREPRGYDWKKTENKKFNDRLRMPLFAFDEADREAVMTFVLGLIAEPPATKYVYQPDPRRQAIIAGQKVLEKYNCQSCHILQMEQWTVAVPPESFGVQQTPEERAALFPFLVPHRSPAELAASRKTDKRGMINPTLSLMPRPKEDGRPFIVDDQGDEVASDGLYEPGKVQAYTELWAPSLLNGEQFLVGIKSLLSPMSTVENRRPPQGGFLTRYLMPVVAQLDKQESNTLKGQESMGWLPPPLVGEGKKVQSDWLHEFLLEPYPIRPAVYLRMPKFNMSSDEAAKLSAYFAAVDNVEYPYTLSERRQESYLASKEAEYQNRLAQLSTPEKPLKDSRFTDAMVIVSFNASCVKCHIIGDFAPRDEKTGQPAAPRGMAPDLTRVYQRLRPDFVREWIANPKMKLPYTAMPIVIPFDKGVSQDYYHGTSTEQLDALVDLLMNFDRYAKGRTDLTKTLQELAPPAPPAAEQPPAATTPATGATGAAAAPQN